MSIRKRNWKTATGKAREAWIVDYKDQNNIRRQKTFLKKKEAEAFNIKAGGEVRDGVHVADRATVTVAEAGALWLATCEADGKERTTVDAYRSTLKYHIVPLIGAVKLSQISVPKVRAFQDALYATPYPDDFPVAKLRGKPRSQPMIKKAVMSLGALLGDAQERGTVIRNAVHEMANSKKARAKGDGRHKVRPKVGVDIPLNDEIRLMLGNAKGRYRAILHTAVFTGCRSSELRGLTWANVDLAKARVNVSQRADRYSEMGSPKTKSGFRSIPIPPMLVNILKAWKLQCAVNKADLVFPTGKGKIESHGNIINRGLKPAFIAAGLTVPAFDKKGQPYMAAKYTGLHSLRHWFASWCINRKVDGGLELTPKMVQQRMGHGSISVTMDTYGHLFPEVDEAESLAAAENALMMTLRAT